MTSDGRYSGQNNEEQQKGYPINMVLQACLRDIVGLGPRSSRKGKTYKA